jgi:nitroreductase
LQRAPSGFNVSPYRVVLVDAPDARARLAEGMLGANADRVREAPVTAVFLADLRPHESLKDIVEMESRAGKSTRYLKGLEAGLMAVTGGGVCDGPTGAVRSAVLRAGSLVTPLPAPNSAEAWAYKNASLAAMTYMLAASAHGLDTHCMEGFDGRRVRDAIGAPSRYSVPLIISTGYADAAAAAASNGAGGNGAARSLRLAPELVFRRNGFEQAFEGVPVL